MPPGVQDDGCAAGTLDDGEGNCLPAGIPAALCPEGFESLGTACEPILPGLPRFFDALTPSGLIAEALERFVIGLIRPS